MVVVEIIISVTVLLIIGWILGAFITKMISKMKDSKINKDAIAVIEGKKENKFNLDGKMIDVNKFKVTDDNDQEILIDLNGSLKPSIPIAKPKIIKELKGLER